MAFFRRAVEKFLPFSFLVCFEFLEGSVDSKVGVVHIVECWKCQILSGKKNPDTEKRIKAFSIPLGLAFQVRDDILGIFGKKEETGKPSDSDIIEAKYTLLIQDTIKNLPKKESARFIKIFTKTRKSRNDISYIRSMIEKSGALEKSHNKINNLIVSPHSK